MICGLQGLTDGEGEEARSLNQDLGPDRKVEEGWGWSFSGTSTPPLQSINLE